jgi:hypothetical protein
MNSIVKGLLVVSLGVLLSACGEGNSPQNSISNSEVNMEREEGNDILFKNMAVDVALHPVVIEKSGYSFELRTDTQAPKETTKSSKAIWGKSSITGDEIINLEVHDGYKEGTNFQVIIKNKEGKVVGSTPSIALKIDAKDMEYGTIILN